jgi:hypothetical protein
MRPQEILRLQACEIPCWMGEILEKGAGHKYVRRVPTGNPKRPWRYYYDVKGAKGVAHEDEIVEGAAFKVKSGDQEGHFHVLKVDGNRITIRHDETGKEKTISKATFQALVRAHHAEAIKEHHESLKRDHKAVQKFGTEKQKRRIQEELAKYGVEMQERAKEKWKAPKIEIPEPTYALRPTPALARDMQDIADTLEKWISEDDRRALMGGDISEGLHERLAADGGILDDIIQTSTEMATHEKKAGRTTMAGMYREDARMLRNLKRLMTKRKATVDKNRAEDKANTAAWEADQKRQAERRLEQIQKEKAKGERAKESMGISSTSTDTS